MSAEVKHTPGPWTFSRNGYGERQIEAAPQEGRLSVTLMSDPNYYPWCPDEDADWLLIAAAPDLLEALQSFVAHGTCFDEDDMSRARAAIAKATTGAARATEGGAT